MGKKSQIAPEGVHAFFFVDPGGTSGIAAAHIELLGTLKETLTKGVRMKKATEVKGDWFKQGAHISELIQKFLFVAQVERGIPFDRIHIGFENYTRRPHAKDNNLEPVYVTAATCAMVWASYRTKDAPGDINFILQEPSEAKGFARNERLKMWGFWEVGSEHKRDAYRHLIYRVNKVLP